MSYGRMGVELVRSWIEPLSRWSSPRSMFTTTEALAGGMGIKQSDIEYRHRRYAAVALRQLGWEHAAVRTPSGTSRRWRRPLTANATHKEGRMAPPAVDDKQALMDAERALWGAQDQIRTLREALTLAEAHHQGEDSLVGRALRAALGGRPAGTHIEVTGRRWRRGRKVHRTLYVETALGDRLIGVMDHPEDAKLATIAPRARDLLVELVGRHDRGDALDDLVLEARVLLRETT